MKLTDKQKHVLAGIRQVQVYYHQFTGCTGGAWYTWGPTGARWKDGIAERTIDSLIEKGLVEPVGADIRMGGACSFQMRLTRAGLELFE